MNAEHLELLRSDGWRQALEELVVPYAMGDLASELTTRNPFGWAAHARRP